MLSFPQMGNVDRLLRDILERLEVEHMAPPRTTAKTLTLGTKHAPEFSCLPLKINIGNFIEALEGGADKLLMAGGRGPCRFGYYAELQDRILRDAGFDFEMITVEPPSLGITKFVGPIKRVSKKSTRQIWRILKDSFPKARGFDYLEKRALETRCFEENIGDTTRAHKRAMDILSVAKKPVETTEAIEAGLKLIDSVDGDRDRPVLKVGFVGEFFILLEPFVNFDVEEWLGNHGVMVSRSVYITDWIGPSSKNPVAGTTEAELAELAKPYLGHSVGGEGLPSVAHTILYSQEGYDGVVHMFPFTCMPDTIAKAIIGRVSSDLNFPVLHFTIDEQTGKAGVITRLEAFLDLLAGRRRAQIGRGKIRAGEKSAGIFRS